MPVSANKIIYDVVRKYNAVNSGKSVDYRIVDLVSFVNDAYEIVFEHLIAEKDQNETIRNHLRKYLVPNKCLKVKQTDDCNVVEVEYPEDFYELINIRVQVCKDCCKGVVKEFDPEKPQGDDIGEARKNPYRRADFYFEQLPVYETTNGLRFYHEGEMDVLKVCIDYYRKITRIEAPKLVKCEGDEYKNWDGNLISDNVDFENDNTYINRKVSDVGVYLMGVGSKDYQFSQAKLQEIISINQLHK